MATTDRELAHLIGKTSANYAEWSSNVETTSALSDSGGSLMVRAATGTSVLLPAPPKGFVTCLVNVTAKNAGTLACNFRVSDADGELFGANALDAGTNAIQDLCISDKEIKLVVSGTGTPLEFQCEYHTIQKPEGWALGVVNLSTTYQVVPNVVPMKGAARVWPITGAFVWNADPGDIQLQYKLTRGPLVFEWNFGAGAGEKTTKYTSTSMSSSAVLKAGDKLEAKVKTATVGSVLRYYVEKMIEP